jgi:hypothetical protein
VTAHLSAAQIKARLDHPIIDADGHWTDTARSLPRSWRQVGGEDSMSVEERRISQEAFWGHPSKNTQCQIFIY